MADRQYVINICQECGEQQCYTGGCANAGCGGRVVAHTALLTRDIARYAKEQQAKASPVPAIFIERFAESLFQRFCSARSG